MLLSCFIKYFFLEIHGYVYEIHGENKECRYPNECNCSYYGLVFIAWKYNAVNKSWLLLQNWLRQTCNAFPFVKYLFKQRDVLHVRCFKEKMINHTVLVWTIRFNVKQVKQKPLKVCITWKIVGFLEFQVLSFQGISLRTAWVCLIFKTTTSSSYGHYKSLHKLKYWYN